jgi:hypothetical protein
MKTTCYSKIMALHLLLAIQQLHETPVANAAEISKIEGRQNSNDYILIKGEINPDDDKIFRNIAFSMEKAIVLLDSPGGALKPALEIGKAIRLKNFGTAVPETSCTSSCAIIWLAGTPRFLSKKAKIGFHSAYVENKDGKKQPATVGNALVGSYLNSLGLNEKIVTFVTISGPEEVKWLDKTTADEMGLGVLILDNKTQAIANFNLAVDGRWNSKNTPSETARLYRLSADEGYAGAQNNLGDLYETGEGVPANAKFAVYWYSRAAERGEPTAYYSLSTILSADTKDENILVEALKFSLLAVKYLPDGKNKTNARQTMLSIAAKLPEKARRRAIELAKSWEPLYQEENLMSDSPAP